MQELLLLPLIGGQWEDREATQGVPLDPAMPARDRRGRHAELSDAGRDQDLFVLRDSEAASAVDVEHHEPHHPAGAALLLERVRATGREPSPVLFGVQQLTRVPDIRVQEGLRHGPGHRRHLIIRGYKLE